LYLIFMISLLLTTGCSKKQGDQKKAPVEVTSNVSEVTSVSKRPDLVPNFAWKDSAGKTIDLDSYRGKVVLINFWATWCGPCKRELPDLIAISNELAGRNVSVIGISTDRGTNVIDDVKSFVKEKGIPYQVVISSEDLEEAFGNIRVIPTTFLVDASGKIAQTIVGARSKQAFTEAITPLLK